MGSIPCSSRQHESASMHFSTGAACCAPWPRQHDSPGLQYNVDSPGLQYNVEESCKTLPRFLQIDGTVIPIVMTHDMQIADAKRQMIDVVGRPFVHFKSLVVLHNETVVENHQKLSEFLSQDLWVVVDPTYENAGDSNLRGFNLSIMVIIAVSVRHPRWFSGHSEHLLYVATCLKKEASDVDSTSLWMAPDASRHFPVPIGSELVTKTLTACRVTRALSIADEPFNSTDEDDDGELFCNATIAQSTRLGKNAKTKPVVTSKTAVGRMVGNPMYSIGDVSQDGLAHVQKIMPAEFSALADSDGHSHGGGSSSSGGASGVVKACRPTSSLVGMANPLWTNITTKVTTDLTNQLVCQG